MAARWSWSWAKDIASAARHTVIPIIAGAGVAALEAIKSGQIDPAQIQTAVVTALVAGAIRLVQRYASDIPG
jgi:hypothetical protein